MRGPPESTINRRTRRTQRTGRLFPFLRDLCVLLLKIHPVHFGNRNVTAKRSPQSGLLMEQEDTEDTEDWEIVFPLRDLCVLLLKIHSVHFGNRNVTAKRRPQSGPLMEQEETEETESFLSVSVLSVCSC